MNRKWRGPPQGFGLCGWGGNIISTKMQRIVSQTFPLNSDCLFKGWLSQSAGWAAVPWVMLAGKLWLWYYLLMHTFKAFDQQSYRADYQVLIKAERWADLLRWTDINAVLTPAKTVHPGGFPGPHSYCSSLAITTRVFSLSPVLTSCPFLLKTLQIHGTPVPPLPHDPVFLWRNSLPLPANAPPHKPRREARAIVAKSWRRGEPSSVRTQHSQPANEHLAQGWSKWGQGGDGSRVGARRVTCGVCSVPLTGLSPYWSWSHTAGKCVRACSESFNSCWTRT